MRFSQLGAATALVAAAQAFLLPPTITEADRKIVEILPFEDAVSINDRVVEIDCPGCPVSVPDIRGVKHLVQVKSLLRLNFSLSLQDNDQLFLNDMPIYPIDLSSEAFLKPLTADQLVQSPTGTWEYVATPMLGYTLDVFNPAASSHDQQLDLISVRLEINGVDGQLVHGVPLVELKMLKTPSGKLMIGEAAIQSPPSVLSAPTASTKECATIACKWRAIIADKLSKIKGCAGKGRPGAAHGKHGPGGRPHHRPSGPHRPHRHHHRRGGFARFLRSVVRHVFIPAMLGVVIGVTTALIGIVVGHFVVFIWRLFRGRCVGCGGSGRAQQEAVAEGADETKSFLDHQAPPPTYEEAPAYKDAADEEKASE